jgi:hypothetical protein
MSRTSSTVFNVSDLPEVSIVGAETHAGTGR